MSEDLIGVDWWTKLLETFFSIEDLEKVEYAVGSLFSLDEPKNKILVIHGFPQSGKSTVLNLIRSLVEKNYHNPESVVFRRSGLGTVLHDDIPMFVTSPTRVSVSKRDADRLIQVQTTGNQLPYSDWIRLQALADQDHASIIEGCVRYYTDKKQWDREDAK